MLLRFARVETRRPHLPQHLIVTLDQLGAARYEMLCLPSQLPKKHSQTSTAPLAKMVLDTVRLKGTDRPLHEGPPATVTPDTRPVTSQAHEQERISQGKLTPKHARPAVISTSKPDSQ
jgi:hypothetical protein